MEIVDFVGNSNYLTFCFVAQEVGDFENYIKVIDFDLQTLACALDHISTQSPEEENEPLPESTIVSTPSGGATPSKS